MSVCGRKFVQSCVQKLIKREGTMMRSPGCKTMSFSVFPSLRICSMSRLMVCPCLALSEPVELRITFTFFSLAKSAKPPARKIAWPAVKFSLTRASSGPWLRTWPKITAPPQNRAGHIHGDDDRGVLVVVLFQRGFDLHGELFARLAD